MFILKPWYDLDLNFIGAYKSITVEELYSSLCERNPGGRNSGGISSSCCFNCTLRRLKSCSSTTCEYGFFCFSCLTFIFCNSCNNWWSRIKSRKNEAPAISASPPAAFRSPPRFQRKWYKSGKIFTFITSASVFQAVAFTIRNNVKMIACDVIETYMAGDLM